VALACIGGRLVDLPDDPVLRFHLEVGEIDGGFEPRLSRVRDE
jgi:hypothetical protein